LRLAAGSASIHARDRAIGVTSTPPSRRSAHSTSPARMPPKA